MKDIKILQDEITTEMENEMIMIEQRKKYQIEQMVKSELLNGMVFVSLEEFKDRLHSANKEMTFEDEFILDRVKKMNSTIFKEENTYICFDKNKTEEEFILYLAEYKSKKKSLSLSKFITSFIKNNDK